MKKLKAWAILLFLPLGLLSQSDLMLYDFQSLGQSLKLNPATEQKSKLWIGLPVLSNFSFHYHNSAFAMVDVLRKGTDPNENLALVAASLNDRSQLTINTNTDLLAIGFSTKKGYFTFGANQHIDYRMDMPNDLFLLLFGEVVTSEGANFSLSTFDLENIIRTNFYVGYQHKLMNDKLTLGGRFKYIIGQAHAYIERSNISLQGDDPFSVTASSDVLVRTSGAANALDGPDPDYLSLSFSNNRGYGLDLGFNYDINDKWSVSGSVLDLGFIRWSENNKEYYSKGEYEYEGMEVDFSDPDGVGNSYENTVDTLEKVFNFQEREGVAYTRKLMNRVFFNTTYNVSERHSFAGTYHARIWNGEMFHDVGVKYIGRWGRGFEFHTGYSIINGTYTNIGAGFAAKMGPIQLFLMSENIYGATYFDNLRTTNLRAGLNITIYGSDKKEKQEQELREKLDEEEQALK